MKTDDLKQEKQCAIHDVSNCCKIIIEAAWNLYCKEAGMCAGAVDYWEQVSENVQDIYICKIVRNNNC
jgi:hypothetical protein